MNHLHYSSLKRFCWTYVLYCHASTKKNYFKLETKIKLYSLRCCNPLSSFCSGFLIIFKLFFNNYKKTTRALKMDNKNISSNLSSTIKTVHNSLIFSFIIVKIYVMNSYNSEKKFVVAKTL